MRATIESAIAAPLLVEQIENILRPAIDVRAPYAKQMITELALLIGLQKTGLADNSADANEELVEALRWYASPDAWTRWQLEGPDGDYGNRARAILTRMGVKL